MANKNKIKLGTSLRKSVAAEENQLAENKINPADNTVGQVNTANLAKPAARKKTNRGSNATSATKEKKVLRTPRAKKITAKGASAKTTIHLIKSASRETRKSAVAEKPELDSIANLYKQKSPFMDFDKLSSSLSNNFGGAKAIVERLAEIRDDVSNLYLESLSDANRQITNYIKQMLTVNHPANFYSANLDFFSNLRSYQQKFFAKNMELFGILQKISK